MENFFKNFSNQNDREIVGKTGIKIFSMLLTPPALLFLYPPTSIKKTAYPLPWLDDAWLAGSKTHDRTMQTVLIGSGHCLMAGDGNPSQLSDALPPNFTKLA